MNTMDDVRRCLLRDLAAFDAELDAYFDDSAVWSLPAGFVNSTGTLVVHCCGNLRHFIGTILGGSSYKRERDAEFTVRGLPRAELHQLLAVTRDEVDQALIALNPSRLNEPFPILLADVQLTVGRALIHLSTHLAYHLGQADGHRRMTTAVARPIGAMSLTPLADSPT